MEITDKNKLELVFKFLTTLEGRKTTGDIEKLQDEMYKKIEIMRKNNVSSEEMKELHSYLESTILEYKYRIQKRYFEYGIVANEYLQMEFDVENLEIEV